jgi:hypothetical protein
LLRKGFETTIVSWKQFDKHVPTATDSHATIEELLETGFSAQSVQRGYKEDKWGDRVSSVRESVRKRARWRGAAVQGGLEHVKLKKLHC